MTNADKTKLYVYLHQKKVIKITPWVIFLKFYFIINIFLDNYSKRIIDKNILVIRTF
jgi:hypothetical protein